MDHEGGLGGGFHTHHTLVYTAGEEEDLSVFNAEIVPMLCFDGAENDTIHVCEELGSGSRSTSNHYDVCVCVCVCVCVAAQVTAYADYTAITLPCIHT